MMGNHNCYKEIIFLVWLFFFLCCMKNAVTLVGMHCISISIGPIQSSCTRTCNRRDTLIPKTDTICNITDRID